MDKKKTGFHINITKNDIYDLIMLLSLTVFCFSSIMFISTKTETRKYDKDLEQYYEVEEEEYEHVTINPIDFDTLIEKNSDIYAWIRIPFLDVEYPILQNEEDNYYLSKNMYKGYAKIGSIYTNAVNGKDFSDFNTVIYGHNMTDAAGNMFSTLHGLSDQEKFDTIKNIYIYTPKERLTYEICIVDRYYPPVYLPDEYDMTNEADRVKFINDMISASSYRGGKLREGVEITPDDHLITLSTCMLPQDTRLLVIAKLVDTLEF